MTLKMKKKDRDAVVDWIRNLADSISKKEVDLLTFEGKEAQREIPTPWGIELFPSGDFSITLNLRRKRSRSKRKKP